MQEFMLTQTYNPSAKQTAGEVLAGSRPPSASTTRFRMEMALVNPMRLLAAALASLFCGLSVAAPTAPAVKGEIDSLLSRLQMSGCEFNRNGSWYSGAEARDHLLRKFEYIGGKSTIQSTEQFIELAASRSSSSGKAYQVRCGSEPPLESQVWLSKQLDAIRSAVGKAR